MQWQKGRLPIFDRITKLLKQVREMAESELVKEQEKLQKLRGGHDLKKGGDGANSS